MLVPIYAIQVSVYVYKYIDTEWNSDKLMFGNESYSDKLMFDNEWHSGKLMFDNEWHSDKLMFDMECLFY